MTSNRCETWLTASDWQAKAATHFARASAYTVPARERKDRGLPHPIEDFLFQYYPFALSLLENWQPGFGIGLEWEESTEPPSPFPQFSSKYYTTEQEIRFADVDRLSEKERERLVWIHGLLVATQNRPPSFACHGLHEWAMVYRGKEVRHEKTTPLRLPQEQIDALVESRAICCSHHDAFRFFAKEARPLNRLQPTLEDRVSMEQPGCVHANMDLYKWAAKCMPWTGSELLLDCFELAIELRDLDMKASPYDLRAWDREPICIETPDGRRIYEAEQRRLAFAGLRLRSRLIDTLEKTLAATGGVTSVRIG
jgi:hypothetical protein